MPHSRRGPAIGPVTSGPPFTFCMPFGDFVDGGTVTVAVKIFSAYSRGAEAAADLYRVDLIAKRGDGCALGAILVCLACVEAGAKILLDRRDTRERLVVIEAGACATTASLIAPANWAALKLTCGGG